MARQRYPFPFNNIPTFEDASQFEDNVKTDANFEEEMSDEELEDGTAELREQKHDYYGRFLDHLLTKSGGDILLFVNNYLSLSHRRIIWERHRIIKC